MTDLIKRIDDAYYELRQLEFDCYMSLDDLKKLVRDCGAEIERLLLANETLKGLCEDYQAQIKAQGEYVPMTDDEWGKMYQKFLCSDVPDSMYPKYAFIEAEVVKRAGLEVKHD